MENFFKDIARIADALETIAKAKTPKTPEPESEEVETIAKAKTPKTPEPESEEAETPSEETKPVKTKTPKAKTTKTPEPESEEVETKPEDTPVFEEPSFTLAQVRKLSQDLQAKGVETSVLKEIIKNTGKDTLMSLDKYELRTVHVAFRKLLDEQDL